MVSSRRLFSTRRKETLLGAENWRKKDGESAFELKVVGEGELTP
jgi:hypothetical protein